MSAYHAFEWLVVGGAIAGSAWMLLKRFVPRRGGDSSASSGGCSSCDSCGSCSTPSAPRAPEQAVHWHDAR